MIPLHPIVVLVLVFLGVAALAEILEWGLKALVNLVLKVACRIDGVKECDLYE
jgi:hypothetical protein